MSPLDTQLTELIRRVVREEVRRLVRAEALLAQPEDEDEDEITRRARESATRLRRARKCG